MPEPQYPYHAFSDSVELADWLMRYHQSETELWVRIFKKASGTPSVTWEDCVIECLRFGWIDGQKRPLDEISFLQRLTPRKAKSNWSIKNRDHVMRLLNEGRMLPADLLQVEAAKADGRWDNAYAGSATMVIPDDFLETLKDMPTASAFFQTLDKKNLFDIYYRLHSAKRAETRAKRMAQILEQLER